jgi:hypothetical protein
MSPLRSRLVALVTVLVVTSVVLSAPVAASVVGTPTHAETTPPTEAVSEPLGAQATALTAAQYAPEIEERQTFARGDSPGTVRLTLGYDIPTSVTEFRVRLPDLTGSSVAVVDTEGFDQQRETTFAWSRSTDTPTLTLQLRVSTDEASTSEWGVERDGWAFATVPPTGVGVTYTGRQPTLNSTTRVEGTGYATDRMAFMGPHDIVDVTVSEPVRFVLGNGTSEANVSAARSFLERAQGRFDFGVRRDRLVVFVLPYQGRAEAEETIVTGEAFGDAFWVTADSTTLSGVENAFAHEYVHSRLATVGNGSTAWLTEATAEYYGSLSVLNVGGASYDAFIGETRADAFAPNRTTVVLAEPETWRGTLADYEKGAHVLAALDAEIRARTDGEHTLYDVFLQQRSFDDHDAFRAAVVETTGDETLGPWLDRYVTTDALPPLPNDPVRYVYGADLDPDDDGLTSQTEVSASPPTNPFLADTDGDTLPDAHEYEARTDPTRADTDGDGTNDALDAYPTDPAVQRTATATQSANRPSTTATAVDERATRTTGGGETEAATTRTETPGFGIGAALGGVGLAGGILWGMRCRRENRASSQS